MILLMKVVDGYMNIASCVKRWERDANKKDVVIRLILVELNFVWALIASYCISMQVVMHHPPDPIP
jgi:hypothetical protein